LQEYTFYFSFRYTEKVFTRATKIVSDFLLKVKFEDWRSGTSGRALSSKHEALNSTPVPQKKKKKNVKLEAQGMAQMVECLPTKNTDLSLNSSTTKKKKKSN
jgi:hypothetical protein